MSEKNRRDATAKSPPLTFEQALSQVEAAVKSLEDGDLALDDMVTAYQRGIGQLQHCYHLLEAAQQKVEVLTGVDSAGNPTKSPFRAQSQTASAKGSGDMDEEEGLF